MGSMVTSPPPSPCALLLGNQADRNSRPAALAASNPKYFSAFLRDRPSMTLSWAADRIRPAPFAFRRTLFHSPPSAPGILHRTRLCRDCLGPASCSKAHCADSPDHNRAAQQEMGKRFVG